MKKHFGLNLLNMIWLTLICLVVVGFSLLFNLNSLERATLKMVHIKGQTVFHLIQTTRLWNARHGGVYVPVTDETPVNPLLIIDERDIVTPKGVALTKVNPAYMTRQLAELLEGSEVEIHLTSLKPLNKGNAPDEWESKALQNFEKGALVEAGLVNNSYRYMAPMRVEKPCLECHRQQGYQLGDLRGGLSLKFPRSDIDGLVADLKEDVKMAHVGLFFSLWSVGFLIHLGFTRLTRSLRRAAAKEKQLSSLAMTDELTGILNRRSLMLSYEQAFNTASRKGRPLAVLMLDIDHFKQINDRHGHLVGDEVLVRFAQTVSSALRDSDIVGRYGGEEFLVILHEDAAGAFVVAERIRNLVRSVAFEGKEAFTISVSIGVAERIHLQANGSEQLIKAADVALYEAKNQGRNRSRQAMPE